MNRSSLSPQAKSKPKQQNKGPSAGLTEFLNAKYNGKVPVAALTAATKLYGRHRPLKKEDRTLRRLSTNGSDVTAASLTEFLSTETHEKGKALPEDAVKRIFQNFANDGKLSFEYLLKLGESTGVVLTEKVAKAIVRKYGKRKDHLTAGDCVATVARRNSGGRSTSKSPKK
jgi:hypothetical protein